MKNLLKIVSVILSIFLIHSCKKDDDKSIKDVDGNVYTSVTIGTQVWMGENLKTTKYNDGGQIPLVSDNTAWGNLTTPGYCWYNNVEATYKATYGAMYNWHTVSTGNLCPTGWHVPSDAEWTTLVTFLGGETVAGGKLKEKGTSHWNSPNAEATDEYGFKALPGGEHDYSGFFYEIGSSGFWWSATDNGSTEAWNMSLYSDHGGMNRRSYMMKHGFSVRCLKD
jgi:uncharacterized protein (TIGR02145 family)